MEPALIAGSLGVFVVIALFVGLQPLAGRTLALLFFMGLVRLALPMVLYMRRARGAGDADGADHHVRCVLGSAVGLDGVRGAARGRGVLGRGDGAGAIGVDAVGARGAGAG